MAETGAQAKDKGKGKSVSVKRKSGECYQGKAKGKCTKGDVTVSSTTRTNVEVRRAYPLLLKNCRRKAKGNIFDRKVSQRPESVWEETSKTLQTVRQCEMHELSV